MARTPVLAAGGIVLRQTETPLIAVVRLRKRDEWVLPKGKLDDGETPRAAAEREVLEETGHKVSVQEFLGTLVYQSGGRSKVVHYWRMKASGGPVRELMYDVRAVDWLPLEEAVARLSRGYEQAFLQTVGPIVVALLRVTLALPDRLATLPTGSAAAGCASAGVAGGAAAGAAGVDGDGAGTGCACTICIMSGAASASTPAPSMTPIISSSAKGSRRRVNRIPGRRTRQAGDGDFSRAGLNAG